MFDTLNLTNKQKKKLLYMANDVIRLEKTVNPPIRQSIKRVLDQDIKNIKYDENLDFEELAKTVYEKIKEEIPEQDRRYIQSNVMYIIEKYHNLIIWKIDGKIIVQKKKK